MNNTNNYTNTNNYANTNYSEVTPKTLLSYNNGNTDMNKIKEALVIKHYAQTTKKIFNFLAEFFGNKFYNIIYNLSIQYTKKNNLSIEDNYLNIIENYLDSLIIKSKQEEDKKGKIISNFVIIILYYLLYLYIK